MDRAPYKALLTHGFVVDGRGRKMSKSKGNVIAPQQVSDKPGRRHPAPVDGQRPTTPANCRFRRNPQARRRRLPPHPQHLRFLLAGVRFRPRPMLPVAEWLEIDRYALALTRELQDAEAD